MSTFVGKSAVVGMPSRVLELARDGTGFFSCDGESLPFIRWRLSGTGGLVWQFFLDAAHTQIASREHEPQLTMSGDRCKLRFAHAPFPFGIKHFERIDTA
ncbi:hypothetical protein [Xanthomonas pisi]|uniref:hypothetical protein n=1 Tax=Xanthomonas pisi TaxID=56457 RepID=UPI001CA5B351|nr:hypothetical protein [Xanthomonas pisi]